MHIELEKRHKPRRFRFGYGVTVPAVLLLAIYLFCVLAANSGVGTRMVVRIADAALPGTLSVGDLAVKPSLTRVLAHQVVLRDPEGRSVIDADTFRCDIRILQLFLGRVHLKNCLVAGGHVLVQNQLDGRLGIAATFTSQERSKLPREKQTALRFDNVDLYDIDVLVNLKDLSLLFRDTDAINANISIGDAGFDMNADRLFARGGRIFVSERIMGFGPGPSNAQTLRWAIDRMQHPWKTINTPWPDNPASHRGALDIPIHHFDVQGIDWQRKQVRMRAADLQAGDISALLRGWIQFLPESPNLPSSEQGVVSFDGFASIHFTADSPFLDFILPGMMHTVKGANPEQTLQPLTLQTWGNVHFADGKVHLALRDVDIMGWNLRRFDGRLSLEDGKLRLAPGASAYLWDGLITGSGVFEPKTGLWNARACMDDIDFVRFATPLRKIIAGPMPAWMKARVSTIPSRCAEGGGAGLVLHGDLTSKAGFMRAPARQLPADQPTQAPMIVADHAAVRVRWPRGIPHTPLREAVIHTVGYLDQRGVFHIDPDQGLHMRGAGASFSAYGNFDTMKTTLTGIKADIRLQDAGRWMAAAGLSPAPENATAKLQIDLGGTVAVPQAQRADLHLHIPAGDLHYPEFTVHTVLKQRGNTHHIEAFDFTSPIGDVDASGSITLFQDGSLLRPRTNPHMDLNIQADTVDLGLIPFDTDADGRLVSGDFHVFGSLNTPHIDGPFLFDNVRLAGEAFDIVQGTLTHHGSTLILKDLELVRGKGRARGRVTYDQRTKKVTLHAAGSRLRLQDFTALQDAKDLKGVMRFDVDAEGNLNDLHLRGSTIVNDLQIDGRSLGSAVIAWNTEDETIHGTGILGRDINVRITAPSNLRSAHLESWFRHVPITDYFPNLTKSFKGSYITGEAKADVQIAHNGRRLEISSIDAILPIDDLQLAVGGRTLVLKEPHCVNPNASCPRPSLSLTIHPGDTHTLPSIALSHIELGGDGHFVALDGSINRQNVDLHAHGDLDLALLQLMPNLIVDAEGIAHITINAQGPIDDPDITGKIGIRDALIAPRDLGTSLMIDHVLMNINNDQITIPSDPAHRLAGSLFNGKVNVSGTIGLDGFIPNALDLTIVNTGLAYRIPDTLNIILNTDLHLVVGDISDVHSWFVGGNVEIVEGRYYRNVNLLSDNFNIGGIGRSLDTFSQPVWQTNPILKNLQTDLNISGRDRFKVVNSIANAELHLEFKTDLKLTGPLGHMNLTGEMSMLDDSRIYYGNRRFDVSDGALIFDGYLDKQEVPWPFIDTTLETEFKSRCSSRRRGTLDATQTESTLVRTMDETPTIHMDIRIDGRLPLGINYTLDSQPSYDQRDQLSLILTGCTVDELLAGNGGGPGLDLLFRPVISMVERNVEERFNIDDVDLVPTPDGNADILVEDDVSDRLTWTLDATIGSGNSTRQALSGRLTIRNGLQLELLQQSNTTNPFSLSGGLRFRWRLK